MKKLIYKRGFGILVVSFCVVFLALIFKASSTIEEHVVANVDLQSPIIILDAGHGGEDGGCVAKNGVMEKDINLIITKKLQQELIKEGFNVRMIRDCDISIHNSSCKSIREKKKSDLHNRIGIINSTPNSILVSIHQNRFSDSKYSGAQMFYSKNNPQSQNLAECIQKSIVAVIQPDNKRKLKPAGSDIYLLWNVKVPAVIVECGFFSNTEELAKLTSDEYQNQMALAISSGITEYINKT